MRLSIIKLSGFKSFVDPTTLHLPSNMTGVVGPNGCGKSNIIDAVRWVMGESSAGRLRGDSLTDVIFSGSTVRKPVAQATVELVFDNSDHTIAGEFAAYDEISVKRQVNRDGVNTYFLNGSKCRRRDITDLFLGTGLGPRSYAIIEQGMISQIVEAKPDDLRSYLEEAAGISKYKERRRETELRIGHTRENLARLNDLREEIHQQLTHLQRQAQQAEQYQTLQGQRQHWHAQWKAAQYRQVDEQRCQLNAVMLAARTQLEQTLAEQRAVESAWEQERVQSEQAAAQVTQTQADVFAAGAAVARIEQQIQHQLELQQRLSEAQADAQAQQAQLQVHLHDDTRQLADLQDALQRAEPQAAQWQAQMHELQRKVRACEAAQAQWQARWEDYRQQAAQTTGMADVERTRVEYLEHHIQTTQQRGTRLREERSTIDVEALAEAIAALAQQHDAQARHVEQLTALLAEHKQAGLMSQDRLGHTQKTLAQVREDWQNERGRLTSLETLQQAALGQEQQAVTAWLQRLNLADAPRIGERLTVTPGWETAVEVALGQMLEAVIVPQVHPIAQAFVDCDAGALACCEASQTIDRGADQTLAAQVQGPDALLRLLARWQTAADLPAAVAMIPALADGMAVMTPDGVCVGPGWVQRARLPKAQQGTLRREREIQTRRAAIAQLQAREALLTGDIAEQQQACLADEQRREDIQRQLYQAHRLLSESAGQRQGLLSRWESAKARVTQIDHDIDQTEQVIRDSQQQVSQARAALEQAIDQMRTQETQRPLLQQERTVLLDELTQWRQQLHVVRSSWQTATIAIESKRAQMNTLQDNVGRLRQQQDQLATRLAGLTAQLQEDQTPHEALQAQQQEVLAQQLHAQQLFEQAQSQLHTLQDALRHSEQQQKSCHQQVIEQREQMNQHQLALQALELQGEQLQAAIRETGCEPRQVMDALPAHQSPEECQRSIAQIDSRLRKLEPVNLAAIDEYRHTAERAQYLEAQHTDVVSALSTLEDAIAKIDRETRGRFKETFERVNASMQALYPRLFGGGHGYLELTGDDLLQTGITIMARPPGKRVSSLSLLSGGEKAMTAVAFVFAIFQLNPAPFCLLDEVDAPLDEANVGRLATMICEMSDHVQFLFVSHNKATMEAAKQLSGVTMREPGVSRLVSVDLEEAARLAGVA